jgi:hypothetical protein
MEPQDLEPEVRIPRLWDREVQIAQPCEPMVATLADPPEHPLSMKSLERLGSCVSSTPLMEGKNLGYRTRGNSDPPVRFKNQCLRDSLLGTDQIHFEPPNGTAKPRLSNRHGPPEPP